MATFRIILGYLERNLFRRTCLYTNIGSKPNIALRLCRSMALNVVDFTILVPLVTYYAILLLLRTSRHSVPIHVISRNIVIFISFISPYQKYTLHIGLSSAISSRDRDSQWQNDRDSSDATLQSRLPGCYPVHDVFRNRFTGIDYARWLNSSRRVRLNREVVVTAVLRRVWRASDEVCIHSD